MPDKRFLGSMLLFVFLVGLNISRGLLKQATLCRPKQKEKFFVEIADKGERPRVVGFYERPRLKILEGCGFRNGLSIKILNNGNVKCSDMSAYKKVTLGIPISVNREGVYGLCAIPGVGPYIAKGIVKERQRRGGFKKLDELLQIKGIGINLYNRILPYISL